MGTGACSRKSTPDPVRFRREYQPIPEGIEPSHDRRQIIIHEHMQRRGIRTTRGICSLDRKSTTRPSKYTKHSWKEEIQQYVYNSVAKQTSAINSGQNEAQPTYSAWRRCRCSERSHQTRQFSPEAHPSRQARPLLNIQSSITR